MFNHFYRGQRVFITGHTGFKGSWLAEWLLKLGAEVAGFSDCVRTEPSHYRALALENRIENYWGDIRDLRTVQAALEDFQPTILFHLAAQALVRPSYLDPKLTFDTNVGGTVNLLECVRQSRSIRVAVFITSDKCYENVEWEYGYRETDRLGGKDPYSASKAAAENAIYAYHHSFFQNPDAPAIASTRAGNVIGGGDWATDRIIPDCVRAWSQNQSAILRNPSATRPWQHVLEPLSGYLALGAALAKSPRVRGQAFNFGPSADATFSVEALVTELNRHWPEAKWKSERTPTAAAHEARLLKLSCDKALDSLHWLPTLNFSETIKFTAQWYREFHSTARILTSDQISLYQSLAEERGLPWACDLEGRLALPITGRPITSASLNH